MEEIGLDKNEVKVYLALLELGLSKTGALVDKSGVQSSRIYKILEQLIEKGLVSHTQIKNIKHFKAQSPSRLFEFIESQKKLLFGKEKKLSSIISLLKERQNIGEGLGEKEQKIQVFEGVRGIKTALEFVLDVLYKDDLFVVFGAPKIGNEKLHGFFNYFHQRRIKKGIKYKVIYNADAKEFGEQRKKYKLTKVKYLQKEMNTPSVFWLFGDYVALVVFSDEPVVLLIKDKQIVESFQTYFDFIWKACKS